MAINEKLAEVRPNQFITTFGPGAILDSINDSLTILDTKYWEQNSKGDEIFFFFLANYLHVHHFYKPNTKDSKNKEGKTYGLPAVSFPSYHVCSNSKCQFIFDIRKEGYFDVETYKKFPGEVKCPKCKYKAFPARFITICPNGHMDDFPWREWVHSGGNCDGDLILQTSRKNSTLGELWVKCLKCNKSRSMTGALTTKFTCTGRFPHKPREKFKKCNCDAIGSQRGASNVYFGVTRSAISIPPWNDEIYDLIMANIKLIDFARNMPDQNMREMNMGFVYEQNFKPKGYTREQFDKALATMDSDTKEKKELKELEYQTIVNHQKVALKKDYSYFKASEEELFLGLEKFFSRMILIHRLREVMVLLGHTRVVSPEPDSNDDAHTCRLSVDDDDKWLPATEIIGEGFFLVLNDDYLREWISINKVSERSTKFAQSYNEYVHSRGWQNTKPRNAVYVLLHTLAHILIKEMAMQAGYSSSSMHERIYAGEDMHGLLIYTGAADKEGSLGGLVQLGKKEKFFGLLKGALENALTCTTDPECLDKEPDSETINGAACHACCMISETACENGNRMLDRSLVVTLPDHEEMAYFKDFF